MIGVNERGEKHFLAIEDGVRESAQSWREVLLKLKSRGLTPPKLANGIPGCAGGSVSGDAPAALLDAQDHERAELPAKVSSAESEAGTA